MKKVVTNADAILQGLTEFSLQEDFVQEGVASYISCPCEPNCKYDGLKSNDCCIECKIKWLQKEFEC